MTCKEAGRKGGKTTAERYPERPDSGAGRKPTLTPAVVDEICTLIEETACTVYTAAMALGVPWQTVYQWERYGRAGKPPYAQFAEAVMQARAKAEVALVREFKQVDADPDRRRSPTFHPFMLERRFVESYGNRIRIEQQLAELADADLEAELAAVRSRMALDAGAGEGAPALPADGEGE